ncbi:iron complex transport system substrate-binding protein [Aquiflexum balticum DSM 16537]|uniref:Iron complex transport system substrate-binding protein n=1 Tax=Aquiflexum balticum DSM 16537 TaxID=758820 RepID=A0A1W2H2W4_9BACT|nr:ABC transporter substrate-binding protein [Aquiflexum balticum]SMD43275.1 iron complex transport system substrate-binding protein [Aquiflexum balticum DSM 16537]
MSKYSCFIVLLIFSLLHGACDTPKSSNFDDLVEVPNQYAKGFTVFQGDGFKVIEVKQAFPGDHEPFRYLVAERTDLELEKSDFAATVELPISKVVMTSTTHIPHLDYLGVSELLVGFPNLDLISSTATRTLINAGKVMELGSGAQANIEKIIDLEPDWVMISTLGDDLKNLEILKEAKIPALLNGEYVEQHPLGRAEWIKFTGALLGKFEDAEKVFKDIEASYIESEKLVSENIRDKPKVMAGVMYKDIWYVPGSDSWGARLLEAAGGDYLFKEQKGTGSSQLSYEYVLENAQNADYWLGASDFSSLDNMKNADPRYAHFSAFQKGNVYTYTSKKGPTGGIEYFELGYLRPDLILQDLIKILYPELLPEYSLYFYSQLHEK